MHQLLKAIIGTTCPGQKPRRRARVQVFEPGDPGIAFPPAPLADGKLVVTGTPGACHWVRCDLPAAPRSAPTPPVALD
jgi:hypothetical protein